MGNVVDRQYAFDASVQFFGLPEATGGRYVIDSSCNAVLLNGFRQYGSYVLTKVSGPADHQISSSSSSQVAVSGPGTVYFNVGNATVGTSTWRWQVNDPDSTPTSASDTFSIERLPRGIDPQPATGIVLLA